MKLVFLLILSLCLFSCSSLLFNKERTEPGLKDLLEKEVKTEHSSKNYTSKKYRKKYRKKYIGVAINYHLLKSNKKYQKILLKEFNSITPENSLKMEVVRPKKNRFDFSQADYILAFAKKHKLRLRGHPLIWHRQLPTWIFELDKQELEKVFEEHIRTLVKRYNGQVASWDVVNEAFNSNGELRNSIWLEKLGPAYIERAFTIAREEDPDAKLFYNDYALEYGDAKYRAVSNLLKDFKQRKIPIDGLGLQAHIFPKDFDKELKLDEIISELQDLGLEVEFSEVDVAIPVADKGNSKNRQRQIAIYKEISKTFKQNPNCTGLSFWGISDKHSWIPKEIPGLGEACLFNEEFGRKEVYRGVAFEIG